MLPLYERLDAPKPLFRLPFGKIAFAVVSLPLSSFVFCILWSVLFDFERSTFTHCDVPNFLPSISAAIGNYEPQKTVWRFAICLHFPARIIVARMYWQYYQDTIRRNRRIFANIACFLNVMEILALINLSLWTSDDYYVMHRNSFIVFIICSTLYMIISYFLNKNGRKLPLMPIEEKSLKYKRNLFMINVLGFLAAAYFFVRHNEKCEPGDYSKFAYFQYVMYLTNYNFHATSCLDLHNCYLVLNTEEGLIFYHNKQKYGCLVKENCY